MSDFDAGQIGYHELARAALGFALETETWPVFLEWVRQNHQTTAMHAWVASADLEAARDDWCRHSPEEAVRQLAVSDDPAIWGRL